MHILIIPSEEFLPGNSTTNGIFQYHQAKVLQEAGHKVGVISIGQSFSYPMIVKALFFKPFKKRVNNACDDYSASELLSLTYRKTFRLEHFLHPENVKGIDVLRVDGFYYLPPVENQNHVGWIKAGITAFKEYIRLNGRPAIIHAHNAVYAGMLAKEIQQKFGVPYIITEHSTVFARKAISKQSILQRIKEAYDNSALLTCVSEPFSRLLNEMFSFNRFQCLHNVLDPDFEGKVQNPNSEKSKNFIFLNIAELHPKKDHQLLLKGFKQVYKQYPHSRLWIGGDGEMADSLKELVQKENLQEAVKFLGLLNRDQVFDALQKAGCFVLTSKYETFGVVVIEAMLLGKPVIVTRCGGPESFVTTETGMVINKENLPELINAMKEMINKAGSYDSRQISEYARKRFGAVSFVNRVSEFYEEAIESYRKVNSKKRIKNKEDKALI